MQYLEVNAKTAIIVHGYDESIDSVRQKLEKVGVRVA